MAMRCRLKSLVRLHLERRENQRPEHPGHRERLAVRFLVLHSFQEPLELLGHRERLLEHREVAEFAARLAQLD